MPSRALESATADLFAAVPLPAVATPDPQPVRRVRTRAQPLWYAAVFPQLEASQAALERLCLHAQRFTPRVSIEMPNALLLEIRGSVKLFGSLETLHAAIDAAWRHLQLEASSAAAPSTLAALWLARAGRRELMEDPGLLAGRLAELPIDCTAWSAERLQALRALGVSRMGELLRLPRAGLARRFGAAAVLELDIALARQAAPRRVFVPRERFRERLDFEMEVETVAYLQKALEPSIGRCARFLRERQAGVQGLELRLKHRHHPLTRVRLGLASITSEQRRLIAVLSQKLSQLELAAPALSMELISGPLQPLSAVSLDVFARQGGAGGGSDTAPQLVERLRARLGDAAVYGLRSVAEHRPEAAWQRVQKLRLSALLPAERLHRKTHHPDMPRPVWLLDEPAQLPLLAVRQILEEPGVVEEGPERIESGWWDGKGIARDYYIVRQAGGARLWVFRERRSRRWYLHGVFA
ncbi:MAG: DNA polymerase Y family protein [Steroidobacteraceae bacterium]